VKRLICHGSLHNSLLGYIWPAMGSELVMEYWNHMLTNHVDEKQIWGENVISCKNDVDCAKGAMLGFEIMGKKGDEYLIPSLLKKGNSILTSDCPSTIEASFISSITYNSQSLPGGFFHRLALRISKWAFHSDIGARMTVCYYLGNVGQCVIASSAQSGVTLTLKASSRAIWMKMKQDVNDVERFFPGLVRHSTSEPNGLVLSKIKEPTQVLILASSRFIGAKLRQSIASIDNTLSIELECGAISSSCDPRLVIVCIDKYFQHRQNCLHNCLRRIANGCLILPVILEGYHILDNTKWWPQELPQLENHSLFVDLRQYSAERVESLLYLEVISMLQQWKGHQNHQDITQSDAIQCSKCIDLANSRICYLSRRICTNLLKQWMEQELAKRKFGDFCTGETPSVTCDDGHVCDVKEAMSRCRLSHRIPCPACVKSNSSRTYMFERDRLVCIFDDSSVQKVGTISCPECLAVGRPHILRILNVLNPDIFVSYCWGLERKSQQFITPMVKRIELETDLVCFFDIHGGLTVGRDMLSDMLRGVELSTVFIVFLSDLYVRSINCLREYLSAVMSYKYIVPVLLPDFGTRDGVSSGWTGRYSTHDEETSWWRHAEELCPYEHHPDDPTRLIPWFILGDFDPIDLRSYDYALGGDDILSVFKKEVDEICCRIMSRIHRPVFYSSLLDTIP